VINTLKKHESSTSSLSSDDEVAKFLLMKQDTQNINKRELMQSEQRKLSEQ